MPSDREAEVNEPTARKGLGEASWGLYLLTLFGTSVWGKTSCPNMSATSSTLGRRRPAQGGLLAQHLPA